MAGIKDYSTTQANNTSLNSINVGEGMLPSNLNNAIRALMKNTREWFNDSQWVEYGDGDGAYTAAYASATSFTIAGVDVTPIYHEGRRIKLIAPTPGTIYGTISSSSFSTNTTINVTWDSGSLSNEAITNVYIGALSKTNNSLPTGVIATATLADGSVTTVKIADSAVTTAKINDAAVTNAKLGADSVNGSKIADDSINSEHYVDGSIDTAHIADSQITTAKIVDSNVTNSKLATDSVTTAKITNLNVTSGKIADASITNSKIASDAVDGTKIADDSINSEHYADGSIDTQHIADSQITTAKIADSNVTTSKIADSNITTSKINNDAVTADKIADAVIVTNAEASGHTPNDTTFFTTSASDGRYFRQDSSETITSGDTWSDSDSFIATTAAIDDRIIDLVDEVGGFVAIANEDSFPTTNPDINDGTGTIVSIADAGGMTYNTGTGVSTDAQTTGGSTVTINSIPAGIGSPVPSGYGMLVETTTTLNTYTFHRLVPIATEVTTVAGVASDITTVAGQISPTNNISTVAGISSDIQTLADIEDGTTATNAISNVGNNISSVTTTATNIASVNNFANVYRISSSAPTTSLDLGDLYFDTTVNELKVYGSSGWQAAGSSVNGTSQRYNYTATSGQTTFTGSDNNGNTLTYDAGYIDVYLNGVKLLNGTDVTVTSGTSVVLASGATTGDVVDIVAYGTFSVASLNADNLDSGTVPSARLSGAYTGITSVGNLSFADSETLTFGTGSDFEILHNSITGNLFNLATNPLEIHQQGINSVLQLYRDTGNGVIAQFFGSTTEAGSIATDTNLLKINAESALSFSTNSGSERMRIDSSGNVFITGGGGTYNDITDDGKGLVIGTGSVDNAGIAIRTSASGTSRIYFADNSGSDDDRKQGFITYNQTNKFMAFGTDHTERMRITSGGKVGIGTSSLNETLQAHSSGSTFLQLTNTNTGTANNNGLYVGVNSVGQGFVGLRDTNGNPLIFQTENTERMRINSSGNVGIGTTSPSQKLDVVGSIEVSDGIYIGGTGTANKLDDYEEGTFTVTPTFGTSGSATLNRNLLSYTKIGQVVYITGQIQFSSLSSPVGSLTINAPFVRKSSTGSQRETNSQFFGTLQTLNSAPPTGSDGDQLWFSISGSSILLQFNNSYTDTNTNIDGTYLQSGSRIIITGWYLTSA